MAAEPGTVMLGYVHAGTVRDEFMTSVLTLTTSPVYDLVGEITGCYAGALVGDGRNALAGRFLDGPMDWLFMVDTDVVFTPGTLARLAAAADPAARPVVTGLCPVARDGAPPAIYLSGPGDGGDVMFTPCGGWPDGELVQVDGCGAACLLIHRGALEKVRAGEGGRPRWFTQVTGRTTAYGEDLSFCLRLRDAGVPVWAHTGCGVGHVKTVTLGKAQP